MAKNLEYLPLRPLPAREWSALDSLCMHMPSVRDVCVLVCIRNVHCTMYMQECGNWQCDNNTDRTSTLLTFMTKHT